MTTIEYIAILALFIALLALIANWIQTINAKKPVLAQLIINIADDYSTDKMYESIRGLKEFMITKEKEEKAKTFYLKNGSTNIPYFAHEYAVMKANGMDEGKKLDLYRRNISHHFNKLYLMGKLKLINKKFIYCIANEAKVSFLIRVIKPMEKAIDRKFSDEPMFLWYEALYQDIDLTDYII